jgi:glyoxalase family protein
MRLQSTTGFHHVTLVVADPRRTLRFYGRTLGLRLLKRSPPYADRGSYQLYFLAGADAPETLLTFFAWPGSSRGQFGVGGVHHVALDVATLEAQLKWKRWLVDRNVAVAGPFNRGYFGSIYFRDPDGHILEIATHGPGYGVDEPMDALGRQDVTPPGAELRGARNDSAIAARTWPEPVTAISSDMALTGIHHVSTITDDLVRMDDFLGETLGLSLIKRTFNQDARDTRHWFWAHYDGHMVTPHSALTAFGWPGSDLRARSGTGQAHHIAFRAGDEDDQLAWRDHLQSLGIGVSPVVDRHLFSSIYFSAPDGLLIELATDWQECEGSLAATVAPASRPNRRQ